ncbi:MAG: Trm112 family protein [Chloroflexia bacterium]|jgi:uncharacterized protein YbaR (Trm112 family)|nr:Trm112 family protein [Chloroflexia bacterium]
MTSGPSTGEQPLSQRLLELLVCPIDHQTLIQEDNELVCTACGRRYPIVAGIPNMVVE